MNKRQKIAGRLKVLYPKANLSTKRIDAITAKLESKVSDDADDAAIDEIVNQANDFMDFGHSFVGVVISTVKTSKPFVGISIRGSVNEIASPFPPTTAIKNALPRINFFKE